VSTTRFARLADGREVAFRNFSDLEAPTIVFVPGFTMPVEVLDEDPMFARFVRTLGRYGRLVAFDKPGIGASDAFDPEVDLVDQIVDAYLAVLDAIGVDSAWFVGPPLALVRANARHPGRLVGGAMVNPTPIGAPTVDLERILDRDDALFNDVIERLMPSRSNDPAFRAWHERAGRLGASATAAKAIYAAALRSSMAFLAAPDAIDEPRPVLVIHRRDNAFVTAEDAAWWVDQFPGGQLVTLDGSDVMIEAPDAALVADTIGSFITGSRVDAVDDRPLFAVLFVDLVASTARAAASGDTTWHAVLDRFEQMVATEVNRHGGRVVKHTGDGSLATFATGSRAISAARALGPLAGELDLQCRVGIHVGEVEVRGDDIGGLAVHIAARVMDRAEPGQVLVSSSVAQTTAGAGWLLRSIGTAELKGIEQPWELHELVDPAG
jgi:class 3 adenylate cyclase